MIKALEMTTSVLIVTFMDSIYSLFAMWERLERFCEESDPSLFFIIIFFVHIKRLQYALYLKGFNRCTGLELGRLLLWLSMKDVCAFLNKHKQSCLTDSRKENETHQYERIERPVSTQNSFLRNIPISRLHD